MQFDELRAQCESCTRCGLCQGRTNVVFGMGNPASPVMFVGEGPGQHEDEQGLPFVGRSGQLLDLYLDVIDLDRSKVYIANVVKCRPKTATRFRRNPRPACTGCASSTSSSTRKSWCVWAALLPSV